MKTLIVSATEFEVKPAMEALTGVEFLVTGAGMVNTAYLLGKQLAVNKYDLVINAGICGCFDRKYALGTVFNITADTFADLGADDNGTFVDIFGLGLMDKDAHPFTDGWISTPTPLRGTPPKLGGEFIPAMEVKGITVNTVTGSQQSIDKLIAKYNPVVESMEGAAFAYVCAMEGQNYLQIRAASNYVEPRNRANWQMGLAIQNLNNYLIELLK